MLKWIIWEEVRYDCRHINELSEEVWNVCHCVQTKYKKTRSVVAIAIIATFKWH